jgi:hypothetical protein
MAVGERCLATISLRRVRFRIAAWTALLDKPVSSARSRWLMRTAEGRRPLVRIHRARYTKKDEGDRS